MENMSAYYKLLDSSHKADTQLSGGNVNYLCSLLHQMTNTIISYYNY